MIALPLPNLWADTVTLKNGKLLKGLVVERHEDRIILSTESGEIPILLRGVKEVKYDDPEQSLYQMGRMYESQSKLGEALSFYEKAAELNPDFEEARNAATGVRSRLLASQSQGPRNEMEKQQAIQDSWSQGRGPVSETTTKPSPAKLLKDRMGLSLEKKGDWVLLGFVESKKTAALAGLKKGDRLVSIDGVSLRYLSPVVVCEKMLEPRLSTFTLEIERDLFIKQAERNPSKLGFDMGLEYEGIRIKKSRAESAADMAGLKEDDYLVGVNGTSTRYFAVKKAAVLIQNSKTERLVLTVRRNAMLSRG